MRNSGQMVQGLAGHDEVINRPSSQTEGERRVVGPDLGAGSRCGVASDVSRAKTEL